MDMKLEVIVVPVSDVDRAKLFYLDRMGFRLDADFRVRAGYRVVQVTPPGSECSIIFGDGLTPTAPGTYLGLHLIVTDIEAARRELTDRGVEVSGPFRDITGAFHHPGTAERVPGLHPDRASYGSFASFQDPDGNQWFLQEVTQRAPGR
ncbi:catechol 2,3-dioxygenase-like lactoylglutathione lyase family enzyme [Actinocorallia herbida]|uniref:Catechol 2,3-dioxygenase-like lactoylglutathione lyase family enzyme n=1 Tax=Actinocorallia herbida TaxID=58109 RepID=A0A3N1D2Q5_9ACTN|nr:VOC family protein [Actinocorallia herbida]ROO87766.1 catechol 2,3-dioxygenase-like lactoylglutathione lyase family enzyme [Actinocorallia herbida]